ncbi:flagellar/basal body protein [Haematococcus lacustris]
MADEVSPTELSATQYVILAENQRKKKALADTKSQFGKVADENRLLTKHLEETQKDNYEVTEHLRTELLQRTQQIADLKAQSLKDKEAHEEELRQLEQLAGQREARLAAEAAERAQALQEQVEGLKATLASVRAYQERQAEVEEELLQLKEENQELKEKLDTQRQELERYYLELNTKQRKEWEQRMEELKKAAEEEVDERLDASVKRILQQNRRMAEELRIHVQETDALQQEVRILEEERGRLMREVSLKAELEEGYAKRSARQASALREAGSKVSLLEGSLAQVMAEAERDRQALLRHSAAQVEEARAEGEALRRLIKLKTRELKNVRRLAQEVLLQRSDVETFLLSSLHLVRKEIERNSLATRNTQQQQPQQQAAGAGQGSDTSLTAGRLDMKDLPWEDRERVLRLLFAKINNQAQQQHYAQLPDHPLGSQLAGGKGA